MHRRKFTLEFLSKTIASFCFGFLVGYVVFSLVAKPNLNRVFADFLPGQGTEETSNDNPNEIPNDTSSSEPQESQPASELAEESEDNPDDLSYPRTFSDLPENPYSSETTLIHSQRPSYVHIYDYAYYPVVYYPRKTQPVQEPEPEPEENPEENLDAESTPEN